MTSDPVRCGLSFASVAEFRACFIGRGRGRCFMAYPDELDEGRAALLDVVVAERSRLQLEGVVRQPDFDERGNTGVVVELSPASTEAIEKLNQTFNTGEIPEVFTTTRLIKTRTAKLHAGGGVIADVADSGPLFEPGTMIDDRFRIEAHIATGGMGEVYRANHVHLKRPVALKLLRRSLAKDPEMWTRFQREAELVSQLESVHIVRIFDLGRTEAGQPYIAMEYVEGSTLDAELQKGPLAPARAVDLLVQICDGLAEAHALGVIHRDLKPANAMLGHRRDGSELVKLVDFGIARLTDAPGDAGPKVTQLGVAMGTPAYIAPEQAMAADIDVRTDLYALGCVAYELLTGQPPFVSTEVARVISMHLTQAPAPLETVRPDLAGWPALGAVVLKALAKEREGRFTSADEFAHALTAALEAGQRSLHTPVPVAPPTATPSTDWAADLAPTPTTAQWPPPTSATAPAANTEAVEDFFADAPTSAAAPARPGPAASSPLNGLKGLLGAKLEARLQATRELLPDTTQRGLFVFAEVLGVPHGSPAARACQAQLLAVTAAYGGFLDALDEDGLLLGFCPSERSDAVEGRLPAQRAALAMLAMREVVADEGARQAAAARLRATAVVADVAVRARGAVSVRAVDRARALGARFQAGSLLVERALAGEMGPVVEVASLGNAAEVTQLGARRHQPRKPGAELLGRSAALDMLDRRLAGLTHGVVAPLVLRGAPGAGRSSLALELAARARGRSMVAAVATAFPSWKRTPLSAVAGLLCSALGVPLAAKDRLLRPALEHLKLPAPTLEGALVVAGLVQPQWAFTAGQAVHALRSVLRAGAGERHVVLVFDGLEHLDEPSLETFVELITRPTARELTIGTATTEVAAERLADATLLDVTPLEPTDLQRLVHGALGATPGPALAELLATRAEGLPGKAYDWLALLEDRGALRTVNGVVDLVEAPPSIDGRALAAARLEVMPLEAARLVEAAWCVGESFDAASVAVAWPAASQVAFQLAAASRFIRPTTARGWSFSSHLALTAVAQHPSRERAAMHHRLAVAMVEQGKANPASVSPFDVGRHFLLAGDGARAAALFQHAAEQAVARRTSRDAIPALKGLADALGLLPTPDLSRRVEALARASALALASQDAALARGLVDEGLRLAQSGPLASAELSLSLARVLRSEARRARAAEALSQAAELAGTSAAKSLVDVERAETLEQEGDLMGAMVAFEAALVTAQASANLAAWHGEVDLVARIEARLAGLSLQQRDLETARRLYDSSARRWRAANYAPGEARALSNLGAACAVAKDLVTAQKCFAAAAEAAGRSGDLLFQARALLQQARALRKADPGSAQVGTLATEARRLALSLGWEQGREEASALIA